MEFKAFRVQMFRSVIDSGWVDAERLTVFVGRNESGKTALFKALHKFKADTGETYDIESEWPRGRLSEQQPERVVCTIRFGLSDPEKDQLKAVPGIVAPPDTVEVSRTYSGAIQVAAPDGSIPGTLPEALVSQLTEPLRLDPDAVSPSFATVATDCVGAVKLMVARADSAKLTQDAKTFVARLTASRRPQSSDTFFAQEGTYITEFEPKLANVIKSLASLSTPAFAVSKLVESWIPTFIYMGDYSAFSGSALLDQVKARRDQKQLTEEDKTFLVILDLAGVDLDKEGERATKGKREYRAYALADASRRLTDLVARHITWRKYQIQLQADGTHFFTFVKDDTIPELIKLEERSRGMQWFLSFDLLFLHGTKNTFKDSVLLLDEPGLHLHPDAQKLLLERLESYSDQNIILYSTHLPFMIDLRHPERIRVTFDDAKGTQVTDNLTDSQPEAKLTLQAALGMSGSTSYLVAPRNLVVEGVDDYWIVSGLSNLMIQSGRDGLPDDVLITAAGGASEVAYISTFMVGQRLEVTALLDSDRAGETAKDSLVKRWLTRYGSGKARVLMLGEAAGAAGPPFSIEDIFPEDWYAERVQRAYHLQLAGVGVTTIKLPPAGDSLVSRVERYFESVGLKFNKGSVAKIIRADIARLKSFQDLPNSTQEFGAKILDSIAKTYS